MIDKPILKGETTILRPLTAADAAAVYEALNDPEVDRLTGTTETFSREQIEAHYARIAAADDRADYAIVARTDPAALLGEVVLNDIDWHNRSANFRIALFSSASFGRGHGSEATRLMIAYGFEQLDLHRIDLEVYAFNERAIRVYERAGFRREGVKRDTLLWDGGYHDTIVMGMLRSDYETAQAKTG